MDGELPSKAKAKRGAIAQSCRKRYFRLENLTGRGDLERCCEFGARKMPQCQVEHGTNDRAGRLAPWKDALYRNGKGDTAQGVMDLPRSPK